MPRINGQKQDQDNDNQIVEARAKGSVLDLCGGFLCLVLGGIIAVLVLQMSAPNGGFIVAFSVVGIGIFHILRGMYRVTTSLR